MCVEIIFGLILLLAGGDSLVRGSVTVARKFNVSELMIGLTLVGFGTSTPELITSVKAALVDAPGIAVGNVIGSNIANILLILGLTAVIYPVGCSPAAIRRDGIAMVAAALSCVALTLYGALSMLPGLVFIALIVSYIGYAYLKERATQCASGDMLHVQADTANPPATSLWLGVVMAAGGIALTIYGAKLLVDGAVDLARLHGISEATIGLSIVAVGTSLPEMVASVMAACRKNTAMALGNIIGSNIYNVWFILGVTAVVSPISVPSSIAIFDIWIMLAATILLVGLLWRYTKISRATGAFFLCFYALYIAIML